jgi:hypothetical protein
MRELVILSSAAHAPEVLHPPNQLMKSWCGGKMPGAWWGGVSPIVEGDPCGVPCANAIEGARNKSSTSCSSSSRASYPLQILAMTRRITFLIIYRKMVDHFWARRAQRAASRWFPFDLATASVTCDEGINVE